MKRTSYLVGLSFIVMVIMSCKKDSKKEEKYTCTSCAATPEAIAANDASSKGIYKGIVVGSSGTVKFNVQNNGTTITATLVIDGVTATLTSSVTWVNGQSYIAPFTGTFNNQQASITFSVQANGSNPVITASNIPGHTNASFTMIKETSGALIEGFEGTYTTSKNQKGTFNILLSRTLARWGGIARETGSNSSDDIDGTIVNGKLVDKNNNTVGTLSDDQISGTFKDSNNTTITVSGKRTL